MVSSLYGYRMDSSLQKTPLWKGVRRELRIAKGKPAAKKEYKIHYKTKTNWQ